MLNRFKNLLRPAETKASRTARLIALESSGRARWTPRDYAALTREGYIANAVVHRAVKLVAENAASCCFLLYEGASERDRHPLLELLTRPNPRQDGAALFESVYAYLLLSGNAYLEAVTLAGADAREVRELYCLRPDRMRVIPGDDGWADAYEYCVAGRSVRFDQTATPVPPVLHLTAFHPLDDHYGLSALEAAAVAVDVHNAAAKWNKALLDNSARPSGALVYDGPEAALLSDNQYERLKHELETNYQGARNAGRPLLLEGGLDWKPMSFSPRDMDFMEAKNAAAREIALAFGVPPMLLGIPGDNTYANYREANRAFWRQTVLPLASRVGSSLVQWLSPAFGDGLTLAIDTDRVDALASERINTDLNRKIDTLTLKSARPALGRDAGIVRGQGAIEHKAAFDAYVRHGESTGLRALETKALSVGSDPDGGYLVPEEVERAVGRRLSAISPIRSIAGVREISGNVYKKPFMTAGPAVGWVGETAARPQTDTPVLAELSYPAMELYAMPAATATLLEDSAVSIDEWLASEVEQTFAEQEGKAFVTGDGTNKPKGFLSYTNVANASWSWGNIGYIASGAAGAFPASDPSDVLVDLIYALKAGYRQNGHFVMNRKTQSVIRKFKDSGGAYLWQPPANAGGRATLMTFPVIEAEDMPDIAANSYAIAFGDFRRGYLIVDRQGVRVLRDPYTAKPYVLFYTTKRVGGGVQDFDAIKLVKFAAS